MAYMCIIWKIQISVSAKLLCGRFFYSTTIFVELHLHGSIRRHLDYTTIRARLRRAVKVSSLFFDRFTDLKTEKNGGFALTCSRNTTVFYYIYYKSVFLIVPLRTPKAKSPNRTMFDLEICW